MKKELRYRIYHVSPDGLLKHPVENYYGSLNDIYDDYSSIEEAVKAAEEQNDWTDLIILPVAVSHID